MRWQDKITKKELNHLRVVGGVVTLKSANTLFASQAIMREIAKNKPISEPCWECNAIAVKLGFPV